MISRKILKGCLTILCLLMIVLALTGQEISAKDRQVNAFSTWEGFETDKCASIWLIHRFIDPNAIIKFFPKGEPINEGIPFDTPDARLRRYAKMSTFESFLSNYNLTDPKLIYIGKIIHDIEINIWERKVMPETVTVRDSINKIIFETKDDKQIIEKGTSFFNELYRELRLQNLETK